MCVYIYIYLYTYYIHVYATPQFSTLSPTVYNAIWGAGFLGFKEAGKNPRCGNQVSCAHVDSQKQILPEHIVPETKSIRVYVCIYIYVDIVSLLLAQLVLGAGFAVQGFRASSGLGLGVRS